MGNTSLVRVGAVCAILGVVSGIMARTLFAVRPVPSLWFSAVGLALIGIGVLLFSFDILRTSVVSKWIGRLGLIVALLGVLALLMLLSGVGVEQHFYDATFIGLYAYVVWSVTMVVALLRLKEPVAPDSVA